MDTVTFIISYFVLCLASVGTGKLYLWLIRPDNLFGFIQPTLVRLQPSNGFLFKSIGGCDVCTRQRFTELSYILLICLINPLSGWYNVIHFLLFIFYGGLAFYLESLIHYPVANPMPPIQKQKIDL
jgi:hypothetical protein